MKTRRSAEEVAAIKAEQARKREERASGLRARCAAAVGAPCRFGCTRGCQRNKLAKQASRARIAESAVAREALARGVERNQEARNAKAKARLAALHVEPKPRRGHDVKLERWRVEVLFLLGLSKEKIAERLYGGRSTRLGPINRIITAGRLVEKRRVRPVPRLVELDASAPHAFTGYVASEAADLNVAMLDAFIHLRGIVPERQVVEERRRAFTRYVNAATSALHVAARGGEIREWNVEAGLHLQGLQQRIPGGSVGSMNLSGVVVDGGGGDRDRRMLKGIAAAQEMIAARAAVLRAHEIDLTGPWRWAMIEHVVLRDEPIEAFDLPVGMADSQPSFLDGALEPLAFRFKTVPAGITMRQPTPIDRARHELHRAMEAHRQVKLMEKGNRNSTS